MPEGWKWVELETVARVYAGSSAPQDKKYFANGKNPFVRVSDLSAHKITDNLTQVNGYVTDDWKRVGIEKKEDFAILTDEITNAWSGLNVKNYKRLKNLRKENLRDNMSNMELVLNMLAEAATKEISINEDPKEFEESQEIARKGGNIAGNARKDIEKQTGKSVVITNNNLLPEKRTSMEEKK
ncbi:MAG TPA: hypothetical protein PLX15_01065 [Candidatus Woesearchaeota archaeon]|nr:hypothetical protein [Candidatus Woesearchaeota archaeon]